MLPGAEPGGEQGVPARLGPAAGRFAAQRGGAQGERAVSGAVQFRVGYEVVERGRVRGGQGHRLGAGPGCPVHRAEGGVHPVVERVRGRRGAGVPRRFAVLLVQLPPPGVLVVAPIPLWVHAAYCPPAGGPETGARRAPGGPPGGYAPRRVPGRFRPPRSPRPGPGGVVPAVRPRLPDPYVRPRTPDPDTRPVRPAPARKRAGPASGTLGPWACGSCSRSVSSSCSACSACWSPGCRGRRSSGRACCGGR